MKAKIEHVRLVKPFPIGRESIVYEYLFQGITIDGFPAEIGFDKDDRFLLIKLGGKSKYAELVPLTNVSGIQIVFDDAPAK